MGCCTWQCRRGPGSAGGGLAGAGEAGGVGGSVAPGRGRVRLPPCGRTLDSAQGLTKKCCLGHFLEPSTPVGPAPLRCLQGKRTQPLGEAPSEDGGGPS